MQKSYLIKREETYKWVKKSDNKDSAFCQLYSKSFRIDGGGMSQGKSHQKSKSHQEKEKVSSVDPNQGRFSIFRKDDVALYSGKLNLLSKELIQKCCKH